MASVLLVDDEKNIRNGLHAIISRSGTTFTDIDECANGCRALEMLSQKQYDLLITDLLMPQMDGIELLSRINGSNAMPYTVILSAHDDFKYAQNAIKYGVKAYLLKPIDRNELKNILLKAQAELAEKQTGSDAIAPNPVTEFLENQLSLILFNENLTIEEIDKILNVCGLDIRNEEYVMAVVNFSESYDNACKRDENFTMNVYIKGLLSDLHVKGYSFLDTKGNIVVILHRDARLQDLSDTIEKMYGKRCTAGTAGVLSKDPSEIQSAYLKAEYALRYRILDPDKKIIHYSDISFEGSEPVLPVRLLKNLAGMLDTERKEDLSRLVHKIFDEGTLKANHLDYLDKVTTAFRDEIIHYLSEHIPHKTDYIRRQETEFKESYEFRDIQEYIIYVVNYVMHINEELLTIKSTFSAKNEIELALKYINEHYAKDLTMAEVANRISLNYSYFSLLFKGRTGINFVEYLKKVRIEKAMELIEKTDYKIYEIAAMVGYNNTKHFATSFREYSGISPKEYRERIYV